MSDTSSSKTKSKSRKIKSKKLEMNMDEETLSNRATANVSSTRSGSIVSTYESPRDDPMNISNRKANNHIIAVTTKATQKILEARVEVQRKKLEAAQIAVSLAEAELALKEAHLGERTQSETRETQPASEKADPHRPNGFIGYKYFLEAFCYRLTGDDVIVEDCPELAAIKRRSFNGNSAREVFIFASRTSLNVAAIKALEPSSLLSQDICDNIIQKFTPLLRYDWEKFRKSAAENEPELTTMKKFLDSQSEIYAVDAALEMMMIWEKDEQDIETVPATEYEGFELFEEDHSLAECPKFLTDSVEVRWELVVKHRLCFKCLGEGHIAAHCKRRPCEKCNEPHHTMLHE